MGALGNVINDVVGTATGATYGTNLQSFLSRFGSSEGKLANTIDPLATFEVSFAFQPTSGTKKDTGILAALGTAVTGLATNAMNNITGGLAGSLINDIAGESVISQHNNFAKIGDNTFMEYLAKANMLVGGENWFEPKQGLSPLELQLGFYVQSIALPEMSVIGQGKSTTLLGEFPVNGYAVQPNKNDFQLDIINTKLPLIERIFYPWMRETTLPWWSYKTQPYTTATVTIDFSKHMDIQYVFYGCRPAAFQPIQPTQEPTAPLTRNITMIFDFMFIQSRKMPVMESTLDKLLGAGKTLFNGAANMMNV